MLPAHKLGSANDHQFLLPRAKVVEREPTSSRWQMRMRAIFVFEQVKHELVRSRLEMLSFLAVLAEP